MIARGEADGIFSDLRSAERERICAFPEEPLKQERWVFFVRAADVGKLKFSSFDDLAGHDVAVHGPVPGLFEQPTVSPELWKFLREHHNMIETSGGNASFRMLAIGPRRLRGREPLLGNASTSPKWDCPERSSRYRPAA